MEKLEWNKMCRKNGVLFMCTFYTCILLVCAKHSDQHLTETFPTKLEDVVFVLLSQANSFHTKLAEMKRQEFFRQIRNTQSEPSFLLVHEKWPDMIGGWTIFPVIYRVTSDENLNRKKWLFISEEYTSFEVDSVLRLLRAYDPLQGHFLGHALWDHEPTIIHHFAFAKNTSKFFYPDNTAGLVLSMALAKNISKRRGETLQNDFSIDAKHELAQFIWDRGRGIKLQNVSEMCLKKANDGCATWVQKLPDCDTFDVNIDSVYFAVKTCRKFHFERVPIVKKTWAKDTTRLTFYSDVEDALIPTENIGIPNTEQGHCAKTLAILKHFVFRELIIPVKWVVVADDDTLISIKRLIRLLSCYNASEDVALGERYGYNVAMGAGYDYITGGGGMVFSVPTARKLASNGNCYCPSPSSPDDMTLGICLKRLGITVTHSPLFHQARPTDYSLEFLSYWDHISFHKHWMIEPQAVYERWLNDRTKRDNHSEL